MSAPLEKTRTPGVFRRGSRYVVAYRDENGRQRKRSARTYDDARLLKSKLVAAVADGEHNPLSRVKFAVYAREWVARYQGKGRRGFREGTRDDYRRDLDRYIIPFFDGRLRRTIEQITPRDVANFVAVLCDETAQGERVALERRAAQAMKDGVPVSSIEMPAEIEPVHLADATVRRILSPLRACMGSAMAEGLTRSNPTAGVALPARDEQRRIDDGTDEDTDDVKALTTDELVTFLAVAPERHRLLFRLLAATGLRISEAIALRRRDLTLDGDAPQVRVRRAYVKGRMGPPKSKYGRRAIPVDHDLVRELRAHLAASEWCDSDDLVFPALNGEPHHQENLRRRALKPTAEEAGVPWAGFHTLRHTCASRLFAAGRNAVQVQRWLGHHSPAFTMSVYVHLLDGDIGEPLKSTVTASEGGNKVATAATGSARNAIPPVTQKVTD
jgi:integrase